MAERLNLIAGDNGLGKSFLLDVAWWALTGTWVGLPALGRRTDENNPSIEWEVVHDWPVSKSGRSEIRRGEPPDFWPRSPDSIVKPGVVLYARVDGSFAVADPARNFFKRKFSPPMPTREGPDPPAAFHFRKEDVWDGLSLQPPYKLCNGLLSDWVVWQNDLGDPGAFAALKRVLEVLSPDPKERILPGDRPVKLSPTDARPIPTLQLPYGTIPIVHASAGMQRILALAYLLVWAWTEHRSACATLGEAPLERMILLVDEVEAHLHPQWQRLLLPALLTVASELDPRLRTQILATTHSPLVLASAEPHFQEDKDRLFVVALGEDRQVTVTAQRWERMGHATDWLESEVFGLVQARSKEAEDAIAIAEAFLRGEQVRLTRAEIDASLRRVLPGDDEFWPRWIVRAQRSRT
ncbi:MAG: ATP-binding protein [Planctomycetes bacterium]|nr:ATP-binding protein [Planctomycetota bacterium]